MTNVIPPKTKEQMLTLLDLLNADVRAILIDTGAYTYSATHEFLSSVPSGARVATSPPLTGKSITGGVFDADDVTIAGVSGPTVEAVIVYIHTGVDATARILTYMDQGSGFVLTPNGTAVTLQWDNGAGKIFAL